MTARNAAVVGMYPRFMYLHAKISKILQLFQQVKNLCSIRKVQLSVCYLQS